MINPTWVYHFSEKAKIVSAEEAKELYKQGWADSPAHVVEPVEDLPGDKKGEEGGAPSPQPKRTRKPRTPK